MKLVRTILLLQLVSTPYNLNDDDPKYTGYTYDNGNGFICKKRNRYSGITIP